MIADQMNFPYFQFHIVILFICIALRNHTYHRQCIGDFLIISSFLLFAIWQMSPGVRSNLTNADAHMIGRMRPCSSTPVLNIENVRALKQQPTDCRGQESSRFVWCSDYFQKFQHRTSPENPTIDRSKSRLEIDGDRISSRTSTAGCIRWYFNSCIAKKFDARVTGMCQCILDETL